MSLLLKILKVIPALIELLRLIGVGIKKAVQYVKDKKLERDKRKIKDAFERENRANAARDLDDSFRK